MRKHLNSVHLFHRFLAYQLNRRHASASIGVLAGFGMLLRLFVPSPVTMADNGDGVRLLCVIHAAPSSQRWAFAVIHYETLNGQACDKYRSIQLIPVIVASWFHRSILGLSGALDARELMALYCLVVGIMTGIFFRVLHSVAPLVRLLLTIGLFIIAGDATFADYAGSPYTETAALYGVLIFAISGVALLAAEKGGNPIAAFCGTWLGALLIVGAKTETALLAIPICIFLSFRKVGLRRTDRRYVARLLPVLCISTILSVSYWTLGGFAPGDNIPLEEVNVSNEITMTVMPLSKDPGQVALDLGLPRRFGIYSGSSWWSAESIHRDPLYPALATKFTKGNLIHYFTTHPTIAAKVYAKGAQSYLSFRNDYIGTYSEDAHHVAGTQEHRIAITVNVSRAFRSLGIAAVSAFWLMCGAVAIWILRRLPQDPTARSLALVALVLLSFAFMQYVASVYGDGNEVVKHLAVGLLAASLAPLWLIGAAAHIRRGTPNADITEPDNTDILAGSVKVEEPS